MTGGAGRLRVEVQVLAQSYAVRMTRDGHAWTSGVAPFPEGATTVQARHQHAFTMTRELLAALAPSQRGEQP